MDLRAIIAIKTWSPQLFRKKIWSAEVKSQKPRKNGKN